MFTFFAMADNYEGRKVGRDDFDWGFVSTAAVNDGRKPYETAVQHPDYNDGKMVIVACYDTKAEAETGHAHWVAVMTAETLPDSLTDCVNAGVAQFAEALGADFTFKRVSR